MTHTTHVAASDLDGRSQAAYDPALERIEVAAWRDFYEAAPRAARERLGVQQEIVDGALVSVVAGTPVLALNRTVGIGLAGAPRPGFLERVTEIFRRAGAPRFFVQAGPAAPFTGLKAELEATGFRHHNDWVKLYLRETPRAPLIASRRVQAAGQGALDREGPDGEAVGSRGGPGTEFRIVRVGRRHASAFGEIICACFDWPQEAIPWVAALVGRPGWYVQMAFDGSRPVATGALYLRGDEVWMDFAATLPEARRRGAQSTMIARGIAEARRRGGRLLVAETARDTEARDAPSYRNARRSAFQVAYLRPNWLRTLRSGGS